MKQGHLTATRIIAAKIYSALPSEMKAEINLSNLQQAAMLHDYGKVLIPEAILNKKGALNEKEKAIMELHTEFGYELLKQQGVKEEVLELIKYHHQKPDGSGYPKIHDGFEYSTALQIIEIADKYSALTEDRPYHKSLTKEEALKIIYEEVEEGVISQEVFNALKKSI